MTRSSVDLGLVYIKPGWETSRTSLHPMGNGWNGQEIGSRRAAGIGKAIADIVSAEINLLSDVL